MAASKPTFKSFIYNNIYTYSNPPACFDWISFVIARPELNFYVLSHHTSILYLYPEGDSNSHATITSHLLLRQGCLPFQHLGIKLVFLWGLTPFYELLHYKTNKTFPNQYVSVIDVLMGINQQYVNARNIVSVPLIGIEPTSLGKIQGSNVELKR